jgi:peptidoglycan hydrolase-like protein with peptidoglycan-binding domain
MDSERATEIQTALIKSGYLTGTPSGHWDASSEAAMQKLQADNGWQTKLTPDSRALIKLGLGPKQDTAEASTFSDGSTQSMQAIHANSLLSGSQP